MGTHVTLQEELRQRAIRELGINIEFTPMGSAAVLQKAAADPSSFDLFEQWSDSINILWQADAIQPIEVDRLVYWDEINPLTKTGKIVPDAKLGAGDSPNKLLYAQPDGSLGETPSKLISFMPYVHNVDSFGYNTNVIEKGIPYETESWAWLLDEKNRGKVALVNAPTIGIFDAALAAQAKGLMKFNDFGNMTIAEIDQLFAILFEKKRQGHFSGFWTSVPQSVDFMKTKRVNIQSMFSPGVSALNGQGIPVTYASPKEGYRAWHGVMCLSKNTHGHVKDAAYEYMNWWLSGYPGAFIARQGYYISNPSRSQPLMSKPEWNYWYEGQEASTDLKGTDGKVSIKAGEIRDGGSYIKRFSNIAVWNTVMPNYDYSLDKWYELLNA
ncbi:MULTISPECIES: extracellular solute-binding protein [unclassified Pseudoalteromonas]|uniref:ABC transporter substrate-binding protein n=1 Tax=unclassified Pseudoalteromonas TaxID=194690 RepID=UPI001F47B07A|nr:MULTISPECIES: extracellular solute-binding protein [unclassified Pseudoalteromonas]MCF2918373.1 extracellular solute-binding protein [Pseudoalteromonas sp. Cn5-37]MCO7252158.1 extracellular solute-binding protein [Pseudoalteromonas sp. Ps84H-4]